MSAPTIRISESVSFPEISAVRDIGTTLDISDINAFDLGLLGNRTKMAATPPRATTSPAPELRQVNDIEFVSLEDTNVSYDVKPPNTNGDTIRIIRDNANLPPSNPIEPVFKLNSAPSATVTAPTSVSFAPIQSSPSVTTTASTTTAPPTKSWFSSITGSATETVGNAAAAAAPAPATGFRSWFGGGATAAAEEPKALPQTTYLSPEQEHLKKTEGLTLLERMDRKGIAGTKMTMVNSLAEIEAEVARRKDSKGLEASLRFQRSMLTTVTSGMEFLNSRYDPFGVHLDGWSEQVNENIEDYDEIFEELYDKYKDKSKVAPEVRLILSLGLSAGMCHITNTMFKSRMPGMDDILRNNPDLARQFAKAAATESVGPGFANFVSMGLGSGRGGGGGGDRGGDGVGGGGGGGLGGIMGSMMGNMMGGARMSRPVDTSMEGDNLRGENSFEGDSPRAPATARREMRGPTGVDDILRTLNAVGEAPQRNVPATSGVDSEDLGSVGSGYTTETMRRNGVSRRRKTTAPQPTGGTLTLNV